MPARVGRRVKLAPEAAVFPALARTGQRSASNPHSNVGWLACPCAGGDGHLEVRCVEPGCRERWCKPLHHGPDPVTAYPPPA